MVICDCAVRNNSIYIVYYASFNDLETVINMGMQEGMVSTLEKLDELILTLKK
jgi:hypothetical protein